MPNCADKMCPMVMDFPQTWVSVLDWTQGHGISDTSDQDKNWYLAKKRSQIQKKKLNNFHYSERWALYTSAAFRHQQIAATHHSGINQVCNKSLLENSYAKLCKKSTHLKQMHINNLALYI